jgi:hypothetical protein
MAAPEPSKSLKPRSFGRGFLFRRLVFDSQGALAEIPAQPTVIVAPACRDFRASSSVLTDARASQMPTLPNLMPELDQLLSALFLVALLLYLIPAVFGLGSSAEKRRWFERGAILALGTAIAIAVVAIVIWFLR